MTNVQNHASRNRVASVQTGIPAEMVEAISVYESGTETVRMPSVLTVEGERRLLEYLAGLYPLSELHDWFVGATWDLHTCADLAVIAMAQEIELRLAEYTNGHLTEQQLKDLLRPLVECSIKA